ncbi:MAG TPA: Bax inhibitor-1/YccA family protein [Desulfosalsimonadaceae bacterium]|nr:Bax inhibitor-1/YccA family protein [Desulfosalsimonadaceae bacterium]
MANMETARPTAGARTQVQVNSFIRSVYNWMAIGLGLTGLIAFYLGSTEGMANFIRTHPMLFFGLIAAELGMVFYLSARIQKIQASTATALFVIYSALNGVTLSFIFIAYTTATITSTLFVCAATFVACSAYGFVTKRDLTSLGSFMFMGLIGIIVASLVNLLIQSSALTMIISYIGVLVFVGLTAYDTQKLKHMAMTQPSDAEAGVIRKGAIMGALTLYLDFINLFLMLLYIMGGRE